VDLPGHDDMRRLRDAIDPLGLLEPTDRIVFWFD
jgi:hypothetical protein